MTDKFRIEDAVAWVGKRRMPQAAKVSTTDIKKELPDGRVFELHTREFELPFENGWTISVIWGQAPRLPEVEAFDAEAEVANLTITNRDGRVVVWDDGGQPMGKSLDHPGMRVDVPAAEVLKVIEDVAAWSSDELQIIDRV